MDDRTNKKPNERARELTFWFWELNRKMIKINKNEKKSIKETHN